MRYTVIDNGKSINIYRRRFADVIDDDVGDVCDDLCVVVVRGEIDLVMVSVVVVVATAVFVELVVAIRKRLYNDEPTIRL